MNLLMADELADDSDDEKHLEKAEKSAKRKAAAKRRKTAGIVPTLQQSEAPAVEPPGFRRPCPSCSISATGH